MKWCQGCTLDIAGVVADVFCCCCYLWYTTYQLTWHSLSIYTDCLFANNGWSA